LKRGGDREDRGRDREVKTRDLASPERMGNAKIDKKIGEGPPTKSLSKVKESKSHLGRRGNKK
jgi:hypothetical protein